MTSESQEDTSHLAVDTLLSMKYDGEEMTIADTDIQELLKIYDNHNSVYIDILPSPCLSSKSHTEQDMSGNFVLPPPYVSAFESHNNITLSAINRQSIK